MYVVIGRAILFVHGFAPLCPGNGFPGGPCKHVRTMAGDNAAEAICTSSESEGFRFHSDLFQLVSKPPTDQEPGNVWADLDACTNLTDGEGAFEDGDCVASFCETVGSRETA